MIIRTEPQSFRWKLGWSIAEFGLWLVGHGFCRDCGDVFEAWHCRKHGKDTFRICMDCADEHCNRV